MHDLLVFRVLGKPIGHLHVIEFQKRGLPHAHILIILAREDKPRNPDAYDRITCAELPDKDAEPELYETVTESMAHGPCGDDDPLCPCMRNGVCSKNYPKKWLELTRETDGYPEYRRRPNGNQPAVQDGVEVTRTFTKRVRGGGEVAMDSRNVVPYNRALCKRYKVSNRRGMELGRSCWSDN